MKLSKSTQFLLQSFERKDIKQSPANKYITNCGKFCEGKIQGPKIINGEGN